MVGIVVDQMRWDYLYRFEARYGNEGFKRLLKEGYSCERTLIPFTPTYTAPGHASVYTGSVPALHGILGNNWYDRRLKRNMYCTEDSTTTIVGGISPGGGQSPKNLWATTITDELRMATNFRSRTVAIALKDRGSILPGGHTANGAYWFDNESGNWVTSRFYMDTLPSWVTRFNARKLPDQYLKQNWQTLYPLHTYINSTADDKMYESPLPGEDRTFSHQTENIKGNRYEVFRHLPAGNTFTFDMAKAALVAEKLGKGKDPDFLAVSFSSPDYIGHAFGPNSVEIEDTYLRFDRELAEFLKYLDGYIGRGQYLLFLTADHGVAHVPGFANEHRMPAGEADDIRVTKYLNDSLKKIYSLSGIVEQVINYQVYLNHETIATNNLDEERVRSQIKKILVAHPGISAVADLRHVPQETLPDELSKMISNGYNHKLSGDIQFVFRPQWFDGWSSGTSHGVWAPYDSHIPLIWFGWKVTPGKLQREVYMTDIAPTLAAMLQIQMPNSSIGRVITEIIK